jgi:hypothetical protein
MAIVFGCLTQRLYAEVENVQRRATKLLATLKNQPYLERLQKLRLPCLEHHGDMLEVYKYLHGYYSVQRPAFHKVTTTELRGNSLKLQTNQYRLNIRGNDFSERIISTWNSLPDVVVTVPSINAFKSRIDNHWRNLPSLYEPSCQT